MPRLRSILIAAALVAPSVVAAGVYVVAQGEQDLFGNLLLPQETSAPRSDGPAACPEGAVPASSFTDLGEFSAAVDCLAYWGIAQGTSRTTYRPAAVVTVDQAAAFTARALRATGGALPDGGDAFRGDAESPFEADINQLADAGLLEPSPGGTLDLRAAMTTGEVADLLAGAYSQRSGHDIDRAALLSGEAPEAPPPGTGVNAPADFAPEDLIRRGQLAVMVTRWLELAVDEGLAEPPGTSAAAS